MAFSGGLSTGKSSLASPMAQIRGALVRRCGYRLYRGLVLLPVGLASFLGPFFLTALVVWRVAVNYWLRRDSSVDQFNLSSISD